MIPMNADNLLHALSRHCERNPEKICLTTPDASERLSYGELFVQMETFAALLEEKNCRPGDRIALGVNNSVAFFPLLLACFRAGCTAVPLDAQLSDKELQAILAHAEPALVVVEDPLMANRFGDLPWGGEIVNLSAQPNAPARRNRHRPHSDATALLLYTSGTTGNPKGVAHSLGALAEKTAAISRWFDLGERDVALCMLPTHFGHGLICNCLPVFHYGGTLVIAEPFNLDVVKTLWPTVARHRVTLFSCVPTMVRLILQRATWDQFDPSASLRFVTCASAPLLEDEIHCFQQVFGVPLLNCYGLTETAGWSACSALRGRHKIDAVGLPLDSDIRVIDEGGAVLPAGHSGEIQIRGASVMQGYYKNPELTWEVLRDGWLSTGDIGEITAYGEIILRARKKELIIRAGKNIYPAEVDGALMAHPGVAEACTVGVDDPILGETVAACVVRRDKATLDVGDLLAHAKHQLASYKCPQTIKFVDKIPKNNRGKINRLALRSLFAKVDA